MSLSLGTDLFLKHFWVLNSNAQKSDFIMVGQGIHFGALGYFGVGGVCASIFLFGQLVRANHNVRSYVRLSN